MIQIPQYTVQTLSRHVRNRFRCSTTPSVNNILKSVYNILKSVCNTDPSCICINSLHNNYLIFLIDDLFSTIVEFVFNMMEKHPYSCKFKPTITLDKT